MDYHHRFTTLATCADLPCSVATSGCFVHQHQPCQVIDRRYLLLGRKHPAKLRYEGDLADQLFRHSFFPLAILPEFVPQRRPAVAFPDVDRSSESAAAEAT